MVLRPAIANGIAAGGGGAAGAAALNRMLYLYNLGQQICPTRSYFVTLLWCECACIEGSLDVCSREASAFHWLRREVSLDTDPSTIPQKGGLGNAVWQM